MIQCVNDFIFHLVIVFVPCGFAVKHHCFQTEAYGVFVYLSPAEICSFHSAADGFLGGAISFIAVSKPRKLRCFWGAVIIEICNCHAVAAVYRRLKRKEKRLFVLIGKMCCQTVKRRCLSGFLNAHSVP